MNNNTTNKKKLELKKTAIANLTLSDSQMRMVMGGATTKTESGDKFCVPDNTADINFCTGSKAIGCDGDKNTNTTK